MTQFAGYFEQKRGETRKQRKLISDVLAEAPSTVSKVAERTGLPKECVVWNLMGMLRWSETEICGEENNELVYRLKEA